MTAPPRGFVPAGAVVAAERCEAPNFRARARVARRFAAGLRFESAAKGAIESWAASRPGVEVECGPWFRFRTAASGARWRYCQPDVLLDCGPSRSLVVVEIKLGSDSRAWWQLAQLYGPVVEAESGRAVRLAAVFGSFDPATRSRVPQALAVDLGSPAAWLDMLTDPLYTDVAIGFGHLPVLQWRRPSVDTL